MMAEIEAEGRGVGEVYEVPECLRGACILLSASDPCLARRVIARSSPKASRGTTSVREGWANGYQPRRRLEPVTRIGTPRAVR